ncbi:hypothetical protein ACU686_06690 [Yinghuangia aomiensis]
MSSSEPPRPGRNRRTGSSRPAGSPARAAAAARALRAAAAAGPYGQESPCGLQPYGQMPPPPGGCDYQGGPVLGGSGRRFPALVRRLPRLPGVQLRHRVRAFVGTDTDNVNFGKAACAGAVATVLYFLYEASCSTTTARRSARWPPRSRSSESPTRLRAGLARLDARGRVRAAADRAVSSRFVFFVVNCLWHLWDQPWQQCLHDKSAHTTVIRI